MSQTFDYVSNQRLLYFTQKLKQKFPTASDFIDDTLAATNKMYSSSKIDTLLSGKVNTETGKGLSSNDFTDDYKQILDDLDLTDLIDDSTTTATDKTWSASKIMSALSDLTGIRFEKVTAGEGGSYNLPSTGENGVIYLMPNGGGKPNCYDEYIYLTTTSEFEKIGTTDIDLSGYVQYEDMKEITTDQIDAIFTTVWG